MQTFTLKVIDVRKETEEAVTLCFKQPSLKRIKYKSGQFLTLIFRINGKRYLRPYSFSSCPEVDPFLEVTVKKVKDGIVSNHINDLVKIGDLIEVLEPKGDFIFNYNNQIKTFYFWGIGSGITPLISIIKYILSQQEGLNVKLIYGNCDINSTIFLNLIEELKYKYSPRFTVIYFRTKCSIDLDSSIIKGRINNIQAINILEQDKNLNLSAHYICGPSDLKESLKDTLLKLDVKNIYSENFELEKNPKDFIEIQTQKIKLSFQNKLYKLEVEKGKSILEVALEENIELPYSCQTGNCSTCKGQLKQGNLKMIGLKEDRKDLLKDEFLLCCSYPLTKDVYIKI